MGLKRNIRITGAVAKALFVSPDFGEPALVLVLVLVPVLVSVKKADPTACKIQGFSALTVHAQPHIQPVFGKSRTLLAGKHCLDQAADFLLDSAGVLYADIACRPVKGGHGSHGHHPSGNPVAGAVYDRKGKTVVIRFGPYHVAADHVLGLPENKAFRDNAPQMRLVRQDGLLDGAGVMNALHDIVQDFTLFPACLFRLVPCFLEQNGLIFEFFCSLPYLFLQVPGICLYLVNHGGKGTAEVPDFVFSGRREGNFIIAACKGRG